MHRPSASPPRGLILLSQPEQLHVPLEVMTRALPDAYHGLPRLHVDLDMAAVAREAIRTRDWGAAQRALEERFRKEIAPLRERHPDYRIVYFGSAPIPLAVQLGFLLETWQDVEVVPHHHAKRQWAWIHEPGQPPARLAHFPPPDGKDRTPGEAILRVSTSHRVDPLVTRAVVPAAIVEIDVALEHPAEDAFSSLAEMHEVAAAFRRALDIIGDWFPGVDRVHLFASVQPGIALLLGAQISKTMHPPVQTYQYERHANDGPHHVPAVIVNAPPRPPPPVLTAEQEAIAQRDRAFLEEDLERMRALASQQEKMPGTTWIARLLGRAKGHPAFHGAWRHLPALAETPLPRTRIDLAARAVEDTFRLAPGDAWQIDDHWLARLARRLPDDAARRRALRMLVLHEAIHRGDQRLTRRSSVGIGRFPKVLEEMDYHADVAGMLYEHALTGLQSPSAIARPRLFFMELVRVATETMWAFDDDGTPLREIQIRRLNRYLIWYWQSLLLEQCKDGEDTLDDVLSILAQRPVIELAGPPIRSHGERVHFVLEEARMHLPEVAVYDQGRLFRQGSHAGFVIAELLEGVRARDGEKIREVLGAACEQTAAR